MQNLQHPATPAQPFPTTQTPAEKLQEAQMLVASAYHRTGDEANDYLSWADRDLMSRQLNNALRLMREAREAITPIVESAHVTSCVECGAEEFAETLAAGDCQTCAYLLIVSH